MPLPQNENQLLLTMAQNIAELQKHLLLFGRMLHEHQDAPAGLRELDALMAPKAREEKLQAVIVEAINELEESRKAFKSKRLEQLRKRLTQVLVDSR